MYYKSPLVSMQVHQSTSLLATTIKPFFCRKTVVQVLRPREHLRPLNSSDAGGSRSNYLHVGTFLLMTYPSCVSRAVVLSLRYSHSSGLLTSLSQMQSLLKSSDPTLWIVSPYFCRRACQNFPIHMQQKIDCHRHQTMLALRARRFNEPDSARTCVCLTESGRARSSRKILDQLHQ